MTRAYYKAINKAVINGTDTVPAKGVWLEFNADYGIGTRQRNTILLGPKCRISISEIVKNMTNLDPRIDHYDDLSEMTRTQLSKKTPYEKLLSLPPREAFVEVRVLTKDHCKSGYQGMLVDDVNVLKKNCIISVENFDVFANIQIEHIRCASQLAGDSMVVIFTGDNVANPKAIKKLMKLNSVPWVHFGDYDPAGIHIGIVRLEADYLIIPTNMDFGEFKNINNKDKFEGQTVQLNKIVTCTNGEVYSHVSFIKNNCVAVMQEHLISHEIPLSLIKT